jgi:aminopeptidase N
MRAASRPPAALAVEVKLPERTLRREPNGAEMAAGVDFAAIEQTYVDAVDELAANLDTLRAGQIADLVEQIRAAGDDLEQLAQVSTEPVGAEAIASAMRAIADAGASDALGEAQRQGVEAAAADIAALEEDLQARANAVAQTLAVDVSNTAARAAVRLQGATGLEGDLASSVETYLNSLKWQLATDAARGVLQGRQRRALRPVREAERRGDRRPLLPLSAAGSNTSAGRARTRTARSTLICRTSRRASRALAASPCARAPSAAGAQP